MLKRLVDAYPDKVQLVFRHLPLNSIHANAQKAAEASEAAAAQNAFWEYHDLLFERITSWSGLGPKETQAYFVGLAGELGLDVDRFTEELDQGLYASYVTSSEQEALSLGFNSTPSGLVDGIPTGLPGDYSIWEGYVNTRVALKQLEERQYEAAPPMTIDLDATYLARVEMESDDQFVIELLAASAPQTVNSFIFLAKEGWFDGVTFHRVLPGFVAQTGDPSGTGVGGPGYTIPNEIDPDLTHAEPGTVGMANSGPNQNGSQWYITLGDASPLDGNYTIFGRVIEGIDVVMSITPRDPNQNPNLPPGDRIRRITIEEQ